MDGNIQYAKVQFYFFDREDDDQGAKIPHALVSLYGPPDPTMLEESYNTLFACEYRGNNNLICIPVTSILTVISMQPLPRLPGDPENLWFLVEKSGLDDVELFGYIDPGGNIDA